jgi:hypothetical protein
MGSKQNISKIDTRQELAELVRRRAEIADTLANLGKTSIFNNGNTFQAVLTEPLFVKKLTRFLDFNKDPNSQRMEYRH